MSREVGDTITTDFYETIFNRNGDGSTVWTRYTKCIYINHSIIRIFGVKWYITNIINSSVSCDIFLTLIEFVARQLGNVTTEVLSHSYLWRASQILCESHQSACVTVCCEIKVTARKECLRKNSIFMDVERNSKNIA